MAEPQVAQKAPYAEDTAPGTYWWCSCGKSADQPFCDGSHQGTGMLPMECSVETAGQLFWCGCKHTKTPPYCDGSHRKLP